MSNTNSPYSQIIVTITNNKEVWLLQTFDGLIAMFEDNEGRSHIPVWTNKEQAQLNAIDDWQGYEPECMVIADFVGWMQELKDDEILIGLYSDNSKQVLSIDPIDLKKQLYLQHKQR